MEVLKHVMLILKQFFCLFQVAALCHQQHFEVIFALSSTMEAETTIFYLYKLLLKYKVIISVIAKGISVGDELEYTDELTLGRSIMKRVPYESSA